MGYYFFNLAFNVLLLAFYAVMVVTPHYPCLTRGGHNITDRFQIAFTLGLCILFGDFVNSSIVSLLFRFRKQREEDQFGVSSPFT